MLQISTFLEVNSPLLVSSELPSPKNKPGPIYILNLQKPLWNLASQSPTMILPTCVTDMSANGVVCADALLSLGGLKFRIGFYFSGPFISLPHLISGYL